ncbi:biotin--[acetyl-CoA-carboxylase] ligase [Rhodosalinus sp. FB01]|uniref:biotin--[acetyl-CoA-carboxylase] ligase n=1 Tax=Rhodosalinus sp. FB01 TaxID=3239194 RepID=UPI0035231AEC
MSTDAHQPQGWPAAYDRIVLDEAPSTMTEALARAPSLSRPAWIMAHRQTAGRGRRGRAWADPPGNFAATLVLREDDPRRAALRSFVAALALYDTVAVLGARPEGLGLKWPNDVLLNGGKLAGILLESLPGGALAIGVGVNLRHAPEPERLEQGSLRPVALLHETGAAVPPEAFLDHLASAFDMREGQLATFGFAPIRTAWLDRAARIGQPLTARIGPREVRGTFETVDEAGNLILRTPRGREAVAAADVYFPEGV